MEKTPRYTASEKRLLLKLIANQKDIIEKKKTDALTNRSKDNAWKCITRQYNNFVKFKRTAKQLRQLYKNMKYAANVNSTSTSCLTEMLNILNRQISIDPNIRAGENVMINYATTTTMTLDEGINLEEHQRENELREEYLMNIIKTEMSDDDVDDVDCDGDGDEEPEQQQSEIHSNHHHHQNRIPINSNSIKIPLHQTMTLPPSSSTTTSPVHSSFIPMNLFNLNHQRIKQQPPPPLSQTHKKLTNKEILFEIAIEERRKKIELLNTQINYWKVLTQKAETKNCCCK